MPDFRIQIQLCLQAPILTQGLGALGFGLDSAMLQYRQQPVLNGSLIRGNIAHAWRYFAETLAQTDNPTLTSDDIDLWLGQASQSTDESTLEPKRSRLQFDYFWQLVEPLDEQNRALPRYRIEIDDTKGTVKKGALLAIENRFVTGSEVHFVGSIQFVADDQAQVDRVCHWLNKALYYVQALGAQKGVGYGRLLDHDLILTESAALAALPVDDVDQINFCFALDRPLCIARPHQPDDNLFSSERYIPGSALKGALANQLDSATLDTLCFDALRFSHALPTRSTERTFPLPLSLAVFKDQVVDMALQDKAYILQQGNDYFAPVYAVDWKDKDEQLIDDTLAKSGIATAPKLDRYLTVRTAINADSNAAAKGQLFSLDCVDSQNSDGAITWQASVGLAAVPENQRNQVAQQLASVLPNKLCGMGKTKARANGVKSLQTLCVVDQAIQAIDGFYVLMLVTDALILPRQLNLQASADEGGLKQLYAEYFASCSGGQLTLNHFYAQQHWRGGEYLHKRFANNSQSSYAPYLLTNAGSVFVFKASESSHAASVFSEWLKHGLPVHPVFADLSWQALPFIPQNGFGEVVLNLPIHAELKLDISQGVWHAC